MNRISIDSSTIKSIGYDPLSRILEVEFISGSIYQYFDVPQHLHSTFMSADSKGQFLDSNIKDNYRYQKVK